MNAPVNIRRERDHGKTVFGGGVVISLCCSACGSKFRADYKSLPACNEVFQSMQVWIDEHAQPHNQEITDVAA